MKELQKLEFANGWIEGEILLSVAGLEINMNLDLENETMTSSKRRMSVAFNS